MVLDILLHGFGHFVTWLSIENEALNKDNIESDSFNDELENDRDA